MMKFAAVVLAWAFVFLCGWFAVGFVYWDWSVPLKSGWSRLWAMASFLLVCVAECDRKDGAK